MLYFIIFYFRSDVKWHFTLSSSTRFNKIYMNCVLNLMSMRIFFTPDECHTIYWAFFFCNNECISILKFHRFIINTKLSEQLNKSHVLIFYVTWYVYFEFEDCNFTLFVTHATALCWSIQFDASMNVCW